MKKAIYLPTFETASPANRLLICRPNQTMSSAELNTRQDFIKRRQAIAQALVSLPLVKPEDDPPMSPLTVNRSGREAWHKLSQYTSRWIYRHIQNVNDNLLSGSSYPIRLSELHNELDRSTGAAREGIVTIAAFLEVVAKRSANNYYNNPSPAIAQKAMASKGFIIEWAGLDGQVDRPLAYSLAENPKPTSEIEVFADLHFSPEWFKEEDRRVKLDPVLVPDLRSYRIKPGQPPKPYGHPELEIVPSDLHPSVERIGSDLFGCPSLPIIPKIYDFMVSQATEHGLFVQTYMAERRELGWADEMAAIDINLNEFNIEQELQKQ